MPISSECYAKKHRGGHNALNINTQAFSIRHCNNHKSVYRQAICSYHGGCAFVPNDYNNRGKGNNFPPYNQRVAIQIVFKRRKYKAKYPCST